jgi:hypothetical protein
MNTTLSHDEVCQELAGELEDMARWLSKGDLSPGQFRSLLNTLEKRKLERFGMKLSSAVSIEGVVHFSLRFSDTDELCASMDVDPVTGKLSIQLACPNESCPPDPK